MIDWTWSIKKNLQILRYDDHIEIMRELEAADWLLSSEQSVKISVLHRSSIPYHQKCYWEFISRNETIDESTKARVGSSAGHFANRRQGRSGERPKLALYLYDALGHVRVQSRRGFVAEQQHGVGQNLSVGRTIMVNELPVSNQNLENTSTN